jgi:hypothetical protein
MMQMTGAALRGQVVSQAATDPLSYTPVKDKSYAFDRPTVICTISMVDPLVRSPILARGDPVLSITYSGFPLQWLLDDA